MADTILGRVKEAQRNDSTYNVFSGTAKEKPGMKRAPKDYPKDWKMARYVDDDGNLKTAYIREKKTILGALGGKEKAELVDEQGEPLPAKVKSYVDEWQTAKYDLGMSDDEKKIHEWVLKKRKKGW